METESSVRDAPFAMDKASISATAAQQEAPVSEAPQASAAEGHQSGRMLTNTVLKDIVNMERRQKTLHPNSLSLSHWGTLCPKQHTETTQNSRIKYLFIFK